MMNPTQNPLRHRRTAVGLTALGLACWLAGVGQMPGTQLTTARAEDPAATEVEPVRPKQRSYLGRKIAPDDALCRCRLADAGNPAARRGLPDVAGRAEHQAGQVVCDMGCGNGFYTLQMAQLTGEKGKVLGVDIQPEMLHMLDLRAKEAGITNIELLQGTQTDPPTAGQKRGPDPAGGRVSRAVGPGADVGGHAASPETGGGGWRWRNSAWKTGTCRFSCCTK